MSVSLFKREPRAVYSVYGEEEYLAGDRQCLAGEEEHQAGEGQYGAGEEYLADDRQYPLGEKAPQPIDRASATRLPRIGWLVLLASVMAIVVVLIAVHVTHTPSIAPQRAASRAAPLPAAPTMPLARRAPTSGRVRVRRAQVRRVTRRAKPSFPSRVGGERSPRRAVGSVSRKAGVPATSAPEQVEPYTGGPSSPPAGAEAEFGFER